MIELRPYQVEAVEAIEREWLTHRSTLLVLPTGLGKTVVFSELLRRRVASGAGPALVLAHTRELLAQARAKAEAIGLECDLEQAEHRAYVGGLFGATDVVIGSVQTMRGARLKRWPPNAFATIVIDEAHHATAAGYREILAHFAGARVLGVTATPDRLDEVGLHNIFESCAYRHEIRASIREGWLCPITVRTIQCADLDVSDVRTVGGDLAPEALQQAMTLDAVHHQIAGPLVREAGERKTLVFTAGVEQAKTLKQILGAYTDRGIESIDGTTPAEIRKDTLADFASGKIQFLLNCMVLTEGFDSPDVACIAMARPTKSRALYQQVIGRGLRIAPGKADCLVLDFVGNSGRHDLVGVLDVLAGKDLEDDVQQIAERLMAEGVDAETALSRAEIQIARDKQVADARARQEREEKARRDARVQARVSYTRRDVDPFGGSLRGSGERAPEHLLEQLRGPRLRADVPDTIGAREAIRLRDRLLARDRRGLATYPQAVVLARAGLSTELTKRQASAAIDALKAAGWRPTREIIALYGEPAAAE